jgi:hypothetical protein
MEKSATHVLLQLIDCIESLKNEVKKKMNVVKRVMLYQSHTDKNCQQKISPHLSRDSGARAIGSSNVIPGTVFRWRRIVMLRSTPLLLTR